MSEAHLPLESINFVGPATDPEECKKAKVTAKFRIIATTDLHMHVNAYDYYTDQSCTDKGLALTARLIADARAECENSILVDNGDFLQGSPMGDFVARKRVVPNPMIAAMNLLAYDAVNIGNHELSHGLAYLSSAVAQARFPCLSANIFKATRKDGASFRPPYSIVEKLVLDSMGRTHVIRVGVIGVLPPQTEVWEHQNIAGKLRMVGMVGAVARCLPKMRREGADLVLVLAHCGIGTPDAGDADENAALSIARLTGVDAIVMGHAHLAFPGPSYGTGAEVDSNIGTLAGKPAVMAGVYGSHIGIIDFTLERADGRWQISNHRSEARAVAPNTLLGSGAVTPREDPEIVRLSTASHEATLHWARKPIGLIGRHIHSYFATVSDSPTVKLVNLAQALYVKERLAGTAFAGLPLLSASAPYKSGGRSGPGNYSYVEGGNMLLRHAADLYVHPNTIVGLHLKGSEVIAWLEHSARIFRQIEPGGTDQPLINMDVPSFQFDTIWGLTYQIDLAAAGQLCGEPRIKNLCLNGKPIDPDMMFILATNSYRSSGSGGFFSGAKDRIILGDQIANRDILIRYVASGAVADPDAIPRKPSWTFAPLPGTSVTFQTTPLAMDHLGDVPHLDLTPLALQSDGFQSMRLAL